MAYYKKTISDIVGEIDGRKMYLPAIQRKYVWNENQITRLMDSIMRGYPFGTFLFWKVKKKTVNDKGYSMYEFIKDYHEKLCYKNPPAAQPFSYSAEDETILSALDGQQRLTSLYISLKGSFSTKLPKKHWNSPDAFPTRKLYLDLHSRGQQHGGTSTEAMEDSENTFNADDIVYNFRFLTDSQAVQETNDSSSSALWFRVGDIEGFSDLIAVNDFIVTNGWITDKIAIANLTRLFTRVKSDELINYFEVESDDIDDVLDIFVRVNSGGTVLSKSDLLFSTIVSVWNNARDEIDNLLSHINQIGNHYNFTNDFVMRTCLYLMDLPVSLKVASFGASSVNKIKAAWPNIKNAIIDTINLLNNLGFDSENIVAVNAILPLIYYRYKYGSQAFENDYEYIQGAKKIKLDEKMEVRKYMVIAQIRHIFGQSTNTTLNSIRNELKKHTDKFQLNHLQGLTFVGGRDLNYTKNDIASWFDTYEKDAYTFMLLSLLYPNLKYGQNGFHQDHMHPYSGFESNSELMALNLPVGKGPMDFQKMETWRHQRNTLANLQLLEGHENQSKKDVPLIDWLNDPANKANVKYLPDGIDYSLANFDEFLEKRKDLMLDELSRILL